MAYITIGYILGGYIGVILGRYWGNLRIILGLYWENGKENGNYCSGLRVKDFRVNRQNGNYYSGFRAEGEGC